MSTTLNSNPEFDAKGPVLVPKEKNVDGFRARDILGLLASIFVCQFAGFVGSIFTASAIPTW